jgi:hypothetical protein
MKKIILIIFCLSISLYSQEKADNYKKTYKKFIKVSGMEKSFESLPIQMLSDIQTSIADSVRNELVTEFTNSKEMLIDLNITVAKKYFNEEELKELINFYETPVGKKLALNYQKIVTESNKNVESWGQIIIQKVLKRNGLTKDSLKKQKK